MEEKRGNLSLPGLRKGIGIIVNCLNGYLPYCESDDEREREVERERER